MTRPLGELLAEAERRLVAAGVGSPRVDAEWLAAHVLDRPRSLLAFAPPVDETAADALRAAVERRASREPLQHILGTAVLGPVTVDVGPGVFVPRPETELLLEWGLGALRDVRAPVVVDLCTGSAALALAFADSCPDAVVHAVEVDPDALRWAAHNIAAHGGRVVLHDADVTSPGLLAPLAGGVDLLVCNPPYVPDGTPVEPEVSDWDPRRAVFGGADGLEIIPAVLDAAEYLLRPGGVLAVEHDDSHGGSVPDLLRRRRALTDVVAHVDLAGRPRFVTARRAPGPGGSGSSGES